MTQPRVYLETTIISYLTAHPSRDLIVAAHQQLTHQWWENRRADFELYASQLVVQESSAGDAAMAKRRLEILDPLPLLTVTQDAVDLARALTVRGPLPKKAALDALHIAVAAVHGTDFLLTWNCKHIANAQMQTAVAAKCRAAGYEPPVICTPEELMGS
jgi:predicted nucleic acid-binding protein